MSSSLPHPLFCFETSFSHIESFVCLITLLWTFPSEISRAFRVSAHSMDFHCCIIVQHTAINCVRYVFEYALAEFPLSWKINCINTSLLCCFSSATSIKCCEKNDWLSNIASCSSQNFKPNKKEQQQKWQIEREKSVSNALASLTLLRWWERAVNRAYVYEWLNTLG